MRTILLSIFTFFLAYGGVQAGCIERSEAYFWIITPHHPDGHLLPNPWTYVQQVNPKYITLEDPPNCRFAKYFVSTWRADWMYCKVASDAPAKYVLISDPSGFRVKDGKHGCDPFRSATYSGSPPPSEPLDLSKLKAQE